MQRDPEWRIMVLAKPNSNLPDPTEVRQSRVDSSKSGVGTRSEKLALSTGISIVISRYLATTSECITDWDDLMTAIVICWVCSSVIVLKLLVVISYRCSISSVIKPNTDIHTYVYIYIGYSNNIYFTWNFQLTKIPSQDKIRTCSHYTKLLHANYKNSSNWRIQ
jgi:hypothetical protein